MTTSSNGSGRYGRFIPAEEVARVSQWQFGAVDETVRAAVALAARIDAAEAEQNSPQVQMRVEQVRREAHAQGYAEGHADAAREGAQRLDDYVSGTGRDAAARLAGLLRAAEEGISASQESLAHGVLEMACALARQVVRQELAQNPNALQSVVREALGTLLADGRTAVVRLHPQDLEMLRPPLQSEFAMASVTWVADASLAAGGCLVESAGMVIDGRLQSRWLDAVARLGLNEAWETPAADAPPFTPNASDRAARLEEGDD